MDCAEAKSKMEPYASDRLAAEEKSALERHLAGCEGCRLEVELVRAMGSSPAKASAGDGDEWTIDRIFGTAGARAPETERPSESEPAAEAESAAPFATESLAPPMPQAPEAPVSDDPAPSESDGLFEKTPTPPPPEPVDAVSEIEPLPVPADPGPPAASIGAGRESSRSGPAETPIDRETSFAGLELDSIGDSSVAEPADPLENLDIAKPPKASKSTHPAARGGAPGDGESWDFEPADARPDGAPPEGSLFFAEEALARKASARKGRSSTLRTLLWSAGSVVGLALLVVSIWIAVGVRRPTAPKPVVSIPRPDPVEAPGNQPSDAVPSGDRPAAPTEPAPSSGAEAPAGDVKAPAAPSKPAVIEAGALQGTATPSIAPAKPAAPSSAKPSKDAKPPATRSSGGSAAPATETAASALAPTRAPASVAPKPVVTRSERAVPMGGAPSDEPEQAAVGTSRSGDASSGSENPSPAVVSTPPEASEGASVKAAPPDPGSGTAAVAPAPAKAPVPEPAAPPAVERPIDRLHLATVNAAQNSDLDALRKLKDTWKGLVRTSVGPDRARGKRELADCLWSIQQLTGKDSDKKEALLAYREYILTAPAGGADSRTVARMRQLEDAMAESR